MADDSQQLHRVILPHWALREIGNWAAHRAADALAAGAMADYERYLDVAKRCDEASVSHPESETSTHCPTCGNLRPGFLNRMMERDRGHLDELPPMPENVLVEWELLDGTRQALMPFAESNQAIRDLFERPDVALVRVPAAHFQWRKTERGPVIEPI